MTRCHNILGSRCRKAARRGHCARRRVSERNRRTAAALSAEIDRSLQTRRKFAIVPLGLSTVSVRRASGAFFVFGARRTAAFPNKKCPPGRAHNISTLNSEFLAAFRFAQGFPRFSPRSATCAPARVPRCPAQAASPNRLNPAIGRTCTLCAFPHRNG